jgi:TP901 family phage tail tape measure protein
MSDAKAKIEIEATSSRLPAALRRALGQIKGFTEDVGRVGAGVVKSTALGFIHGIGMSVANRGLDLMIDQGKKVIDFERELTRLGIDLNKQPVEMRAIGEGIREISNQVGIGADKVLAAGRSYADLAGLEAFTMERMSLIARAAQASGSDVQDMAALMFTLTENMKVPDNQLEDTIGGLINQAKYGSIHFKELAKELVALGAVYSQYGVSGREGAIQMGAQMQLARHGFASASEAATGVLRIYRSLPQHASKFAKAGVDIWKPGSKTAMRPFEDIIHQIQKSRLSLDREQLIKSFGRTEGERFYQVLVALTDQYDKMKAAGEANGVVAKDLATYTESAAGRIDVAVERMKNGFAQVLTPERIDQIVGGIERIAQAMPSIVGAIGYVVDAFSGMAHLFHTWDDNKLKIYRESKEEEEAMVRDFFGIDPAAAAKVDRVMAKKRAYEGEISDILIKEDATGPSQASIRQAIRDRDRKGPLTDRQEGFRAAGEAYLKDRGVAPYIIERERQHIEREDKAELAKDAAELQKKALADAVEYGVKNGFLAAMQQHPFFRGPTTAGVYIDGDNVGSALDNAYRHRSR